MQEIIKATPKYGTSSEDLIRVSEEMKELKNKVSELSRSLIETKKQYEEKCKEFALLEPLFDIEYKPIEHHSIEKTEVYGRIINKSDPSGYGH